MSGRLFGCSATIAKYHGGAGDRHQEKKSVTSKIGGGKTLLVLVTPQGKEGHKDMLHLLEGLQHLNRGGDGGMFLGRQRGRHRKAHLWSAMGKGQEHHWCCASGPAILTKGEGRALPMVVSASWQEEKMQGKGFLGHSPLLLWDCWWRRVGAGLVCRWLAFYSKGHIFSTEWKK